MESTAVKRLCEMVERAMIEKSWHQYRSQHSGDIASLLSSLRLDEFATVLNSLTTSPDFHVRKAIAAALATMDLQHMVVTSALVSALQDLQPSVREVACYALRERPASIVAQPLINMLHDDIPCLRAAAADVLGSIDHSGSIAPLFDCLSDSEMAVRRNAALSLYRLCLQFLKQCRNQADEPDPEAVRLLKSLDETVASMTADGMTGPAISDEDEALNASTDTGPGAIDDQMRLAIDLRVAAQRGDCEQIRFLIDAGADVNCMDHEGDLPLHFAVICDRTAAVRLLLEHNADVNKRDRSGMTPLALAVIGGLSDIVTILLDSGADVDAEDLHHSTPLSIAVQKGHTAIVTLLLERNADPDIADDRRLTPFDYAARDGIHLQEMMSAFRPPQMRREPTLYRSGSRKVRTVVSSAAQADVVVMLVSAIGDQITAWPTIRALAELFHGRLRLILGPGMFPFYRDVSCRRQLLVSWKDQKVNEIAVDEIASKIGRCEVFINLAEWITDSVRSLMRQIRPQLSMGFLPDYDEHVLIRDDVHMFDKMFALAQRIDGTIKIDHFVQPPVFHPVGETIAFKFVRDHIRSGEKLLFVHPETHVRKLWSAASFSAVLQEFLTQHPEYRVLICTKDDHDIRLGQRSDRVINARLSLIPALAILRYADLFLGIDSCFLHAADLYRIPGVALFGATRADRWGFRFSPCSRVIDRPSMSAITPADVLEALLDIAK